MKKETVLTCALLAHAAYDPHPDKLDLSLIEPGLVLERRIYDPETTTDGIIGVNASTKTIYIAFKGTEGMKDLLIDADIRLKDITILGKELDVHSGFLEAWTSVKSQLEAFDFSKYPGFDIYVTGHSLGGALATMTCYLLKMPTLPHLCTFGSPKVGTKVFANLCSTITDESIRMVHDDDLVPLIPNGPYVHVDSRIHLDDNGKPMGTFTVIKRIIYWLKGKLPLRFFSLSEHAMKDYISVVKKWSSLP